MEGLNLTEAVMTRSVTIVNTGNWENEDILVKRATDGRQSSYEELGVLRVGETMKCHYDANPKTMYLALAPVSEQQAKPMYDHLEDDSEVQVFPQVECYMAPRNDIGAHMDALENALKSKNELIAQLREQVEEQKRLVKMLHV